MLIVEYWTDTQLLNVALDHAPEMVLYDEEQYASDGCDHYLFWAEGSEYEAFETGLGADPSVVDSRTITETETRRLYRVVTTGAADGRSTVGIWRDLDIVLLETRGTVDGWTIRIRVPDRETLAHYRRLHREEDVPFRLESLYHESDPDAAPGATLTADQRQALLAAYEAGYFDVPRAASQSDLADRFDISSQSLSERLRRGTAALVERALIDRRLGDLKP